MNIIYLNKNINIKKLYFILFFLVAQTVNTQIPSDKIIGTNELSNYLSIEAKTKIGLKQISNAQLANYLRDKFSERYFYDWRENDKRFSQYQKLYPGQEGSHQARALDHMTKFLDSTKWLLPFNYQNGQPVNAYALRHLARQHKMVDIAYQYHYQEKNPKYIHYFTKQLRSLNAAFHASKYERIDEGNGVYEAFRSGYRVLNWLHIHNLFLGEKTYTDEDQLITVATLLQHGAHLFERNAKFKSGNHQTRGLSALAMLSILLRDFEGTDKWFEHAMNLLEEHLRKEINEDGFQFERTVHYHMSDIGNYYYVYQLAKISGLDVRPFWKEKLKSLFVSLTKIAYPDKFTPVLSDDTDNPWAEKNDISGALTLGYLLFESPEMGYFANNQVEAKMFWYVTDEQLGMLQDITAQTPTMKSVDFPITGYYIMREGWEPDDKMMVISAGLDDLKPDHQHGDMLGIQAMANGKVILPNYQVRYSLRDLELFKNSMTKNVALVDDELQGKNYTSNKGGSGFGKFRQLPNPKTGIWNTDKNLDIYVGSHDGFENVGVSYSRQILYVRDDFWIVKDNFNSDAAHTYKQVWQGHYSLEESPNLIRATFDDASGFDIYQLNAVDTVQTSGQRGKQWSVVSKNDQSSFSFITVLYPYKGYANRLDENSENVMVNGWNINNSLWKLDGDKPVSLSKENEALIFSVKELTFKDLNIAFSDLSDVSVRLDNKGVKIQSLGDKSIDLTMRFAKIEEKMQLQPGEVFSYTF